MEIENVGSQQIEYIETDFEMGIELTGLSDEDTERLSQLFDTCRNLEDNICTAEVSGDWLLFLEVDKRTHRDLYFGIPGSLEQFIENTEEARIVGIQSVELVEHNFWRTNPSG